MAHITTKTYTRTVGAIASPVGSAQTATTTAAYGYVSITVSENVANTCQNAIRFGTPLQPNPDISGLGVVMAFVISAYVVQCWSVFAYFAGLLPPGLLRAVDARMFKANSRRFDSEWHDALEKAAIIFSDQQIITGIGILLAGYCNLGNDLSVYHWETITYLAWMSSNVHLTTLTLLKGWLQSNVVLRRWRIAGMTLLMILLACALVPTRTIAWVDALSDFSEINLLPGYGLGVPAICFWSHSGPLNLDAPWSFAILGVSYVWKMGQLFDASRFRLKKWLRSGPEWLVERTAMRAITAKFESTHGWAIGLRIRCKLILALYVPMVAFYEFFDSFVASLWMLTISLAWGSLQIFKTRRLAPVDVVAAESVWGFGQILPMLFLLQPAVALFEHFYASHKRGRVEREEAAAHELEPTHTDQRTSKKGLPASTSTISSMADIEPGTSFDVPPDTLSSVMRTMELKSPALKAGATDLEPHIEYMYSSKFFKFLIWWENGMAFCYGFIILFQTAPPTGGVFQTWEMSLWALSCVGFSTLLLSFCATFGSKLYK